MHPVCPEPSEELSFSDLLCPVRRAAVRSHHRQSADPRPAIAGGNHEAVSADRQCDGPAVFRPRSAKPIRSPQPRSTQAPRHRNPATASTPTQPGVTPAKTSRFRSQGAQQSNRAESLSMNTASTVPVPVAEGALIASRPRYASRLSHILCGLQAEAWKSSFASASGNGPIPPSGPQPPEDRGCSDRAGAGRNLLANGRSAAIRRNSSITVALSSAR